MATRAALLPDSLLIAMATTRRDPRASRLGRFAPYVDDPVGFGEHVLQAELWSKQREILESVRDHRRTAVRACHDSSKSFTASVVASWWLSCSEPGDAFVVSTAPTYAQVRAILWREIGRRHRQGLLPGRVNQTEWLIDNELVAFGRKPADWDIAAFQGIHANRVLVLIDEADGVPEQIFNAAEALVTNDASRILAIGNPDNPQSYFATRQRPGSIWNVIHIGYEDTPAVTGEPISDRLRALLISKRWVEERANEWGEDSALYRAKVQGEYPEDSDDGVVPWSWVQRCRKPDIDTLAEVVDAEVELGVDVGAGGDETVIYERRGPRAGRCWAYKTPDAMDAVGYVMQAIGITGAKRVKIDAIGVGWGVSDRLRELSDEGKHDAIIVPVRVSEGSDEPEKFPRLRDQVWWEIGRELSRMGGWDLTEVDDMTLAQLTAPKYRIDSSGRVKVEAKEDTIKRLGNSPDRADALLLAFFDRGGPIIDLIQF